MRAVALAVVALAVPSTAMACEFHGGPWGLAFARMMHAGQDQPAADASPEAQAQANEAALATLRAQFLQRFNVKVEGEPAAPAAAPAPAATPAPPAP